MVTRRCSRYTTGTVTDYPSIRCRRHVHALRVRRRDSARPARAGRGAEGVPRPASSSSARSTRRTCSPSPTSRSASSRSSSTARASASPRSARRSARSRSTRRSSRTWTSSSGRSNCAACSARRTSASSATTRPATTRTSTRRTGRRTATRSCAGCARRPRLAAKSNVVLFHENEHRIYGDSPDRVADILATVNSPALRAAYDAANYIYGNFDPVEGWEKTKAYTAHFHIKDWKKRRARGRARVRRHRRHRRRQDRAQHPRRGRDGLQGLRDDGAAPARRRPDRRRHRPGPVPLRGRGVPQDPPRLRRRRKSRIHHRERRERRETKHR